MGPWWPEKVHTIFSADVLALRLQEMTMPCSVPTMNLVGCRGGNRSGRSQEVSTLSLAGVASSLPQGRRQCCRASCLNSAQAMPLRENCPHSSQPQKTHSSFRELVQ